MAKSLSIGLLSPSWPEHRIPNGITTATRHLSAGIEAAGHKVTILAMTCNKRETSARVIAVAPDRHRLLDRVRYRFGATETVFFKTMTRDIASAARTAIRKHGIDVLFMEETHGWAGPVADALPIPVIVTLHGPWFLHKRHHSNGDTTVDAAREAREATGMRRAAGITAPSHAVLDAAETAYDLPDRPRACIPNPVSLAFDPKWSDGPHPGSILFVGRFDRHKGGDVVLAAFEKLSDRFPEARLTFAGTDPGVRRNGAPRLHIGTALAALRSAVRERVRYVGPVSPEALADLRRSHAVTVIASRFENLNYTLLEALAAGSPIVCTDVGGPAEVLADGKTALLIPPDNPEALATAIGRLIADPELARSLGRAARDLAASRFSTETVANDMIAFARTVLGQHERRIAS